MRKTILITGASSGLGSGMAREFAKMGRDLALCARRVDRLEELKAELLRSNPNIRVFVRALDVNDYDQVFEVFRAFKQDLGSLDRIIVNAGIGKGQPLGTGFFHANRQTAETNFVAALAQCEAAARDLPQAERRAPGDHLVDERHARHAAKRHDLRCHQGRPGRAHRGHPRRPDRTRRSRSAPSTPATSAPRSTRR